MDGKDVIVDAKLQEQRTHGNLEYPVGTYTLEIQKKNMVYIRWHWHEELEISIIKKGSAVFSVGEEAFILKEGDSILINQNMLHSIHPNDDSVAVIQVVVFHPAYLFGYGDTYMQGKYLTPVVGATTMKYLLFNKPNEFNDQVHSFIHTIIDANLEKKFGYEILTKSILCQLWLKLLEHVSAFHPRMEQMGSLSLDESRAKQGLVFIQDNYADPITLDSIADAIHVSKSECCRCFKRTLKLTPFQYLIKYRIYMATILIAQNDPRASSVANLALSVGFNNTSYFNKWFRFYLKCTPSQYKRELMNHPLPESFANDMDLTYFNTDI